MVSLEDVVKMINTGNIIEAYKVLNANPEILSEFLKNVKNARQVLEHILVAVMLRTKKIPESNSPIYSMFKNSEPVKLAVKYIMLERARNNINHYISNNDLDGCLEYILNNYKRFGGLANDIVFYAFAKFIEKNHSNPTDLASVINKFSELFKRLNISLPDNVKALTRLAKLLHDIETGKKEIAEQSAKRVAEELKKNISSIIHNYKGKIAEALSSPKFIALAQFLGIPKPILEEAKIIAETGIHNMFKKLLSMIHGANIEALASRWGKIYTIGERIYNVLNKYRAKIGDYYDKYMEALKKTLLSVGYPIFVYYLRQGKISLARNIISGLSRLGIDTSRMEHLLALYSKIKSTGITPHTALGILHEVE